MKNTLKKFFNELVLKASFIIMKITILILSKKKRVFESFSKLNIEYPYLFFPYPSPDCLILHRGLSLCLINNNIEADILKRDKLPDLDINKYIYVANNSEPNDRQCFRFHDLINELRILCKKQNIADLFYPLVDTIMRELNYEKFFSELFFDINLLTKIKKIYQEIENISNKYNSCFIADSAYFHNQILKQIFLKKGKKIYYLNPRGYLLAYSRYNVSEYSCPELNFNKLPKNLSDVENFTNKKFKLTGSLNTLLPKNIPIRKILYLHSFRDSNNTTWVHGQNFSNYLEWAEYSFNKISLKNDWKNWYLKIHPDSKFYDSENLILDFLKKKYSIPDSCLIDCPDRETILKHKMPIFSASGTIVLETLIHGYKSFFCQPRFAQEFGVYSRDRLEWSQYLSLDTQQIVELISSPTEKMISLAKVVYWEQFYRKNIEFLVPNLHVQPGFSSFKIATSVANQLFQVLKTNNNEIVLDSI